MLTKEDRSRLVANPQIIQDEVIFCLVSVINFLGPHYFFKRVLNYPLAITWLQLLVGSFYLFIMGEFSLEFPRYSQFNPFTIKFLKLKQLIVPSLAYTAMLLCSNVLLSRIVSPAYYPVAASFAVVVHHFTRFIGCGQIYSVRRWSGQLVIMVGFLIYLFDSDNTSRGVCGIAILYGIICAFYRGAFLERALHEVKGNNNELQAAQNFIGIIVLSVILLFSREKNYLYALPSHSTITTYLIYGCISSLATFPLIKNVVSNRLIRATGQSQWRLLELLSMILVFVLGQMQNAQISFAGIIAFLLVLVGRGMNSFDVIEQTSLNGEHRSMKTSSKTISSRTSKSKTKKTSSKKTVVQEENAVEDVALEKL